MQFQRNNFAIPDTDDVTSSRALVSCPNMSICRTWDDKYAVAAKSSGSGRLHATTVSTIESAWKWIYVSM
jgi:hypothetical protein